MGLLGNVFMFGGLSKDKKPLPVIDSSFLAYDTGQIWWVKNGQWAQMGRRIKVYVQSDFPEPINGVIRLVDGYVYEITGSIDIGTNRIVCGNRNVISGTDRLSDALISHTTDTLFTSLSKFATVFSNITFSVPSGQLLDVDSTAIIISDSRILNTARLGNTRNTPSFIVQACDIVTNLVMQSGFVFSGINGFIRFYDNIIRSGVPITLDLANAMFSVIDIQRNIVTTGSDQLFLSGLPGGANILHGAKLSDNFFIGNPVPISGISRLDPKWMFWANFGIANTPVGQVL